MKLLVISYWVAKRCLRLPNWPDEVEIKEQKVLKANHTFVIPESDPRFLRCVHENQYSDDEIKKETIKDSIHLDSESLINWPEGDGLAMYVNDYDPIIFRHRIIDTDSAPIVGAPAKFLFIKYTTKVRCDILSRPYVVARTEKDVENVFVISSDDYCFKTWTGENGKPSINDINDDLFYRVNEPNFETIFEEESKIGVIRCKVMGDPEITECKIIEVGGLL